MGGRRHFGVRILLASAALCALISVVSRYPVNERIEDASHVASENAEMERLIDVVPATVSVEPLMDIESCWGIEDTHAESKTLLVTRMRCGESELGFDAETNTFYCTLGVGCDQWPELPLQAAGAESLRVAWADDYAWDDVRDAVRENMSYRLMAWTDEAYSYVGIVFTGMPIITLHVTDYPSLDDQYVPARFTLSSTDYPTVDMPARTHLRSGGYSKRYDKWSYRVELEHKTAKGRYASKRVPLLDMEEDSDWLLISNASDDTVMRNHLGWQLWNRFYPEGGGVAALQSRLVEVFVQDQYMGIYQLLQRIKPEKEIARLNGNLKTDGMARIIKTKHVGERPAWRLWSKCNFVLEMRRTPDGTLYAGQKIFGDYVDLSAVEKSRQQLDSATFSTLAAQCVDVRQMMEYFLFMQAAGLPYDNVMNNVYICAVRRAGHYVYYFAPWDMDMGFKQLFPNAEDNLNEWMVLPVRMLRLNTAGCRDILWEIWEEKRATILSDDAIEDWMQEQEDYVNASGAFLRETAKWRGEPQPLRLKTLISFTTEHMSTIEAYLREEWTPSQLVHQEE